MLWFELALEAGSRSHLATLDLDGEADLPPLQWHVSRRPDLAREKRQWGGGAGLPHLGLALPRAHLGVVAVRRDAAVEARLRLPLQPGFKMFNLER